MNAFGNKACSAEFAAGFRSTYPAIIRTWESVWEEFVYPVFSVERRHIVSTRNGVESLNARFRRG